MVVRLAGMANERERHRDSGLSTRNKLNSDGEILHSLAPRAFFPADGRNVAQLEAGGGAKVAWQSRVLSIAVEGAGT